jgi:hypothetical protein
VAHVLPPNAAPASKGLVVAPKVRGGQSGARLSRSSPIANASEQPSMSRTARQANNSAFKSGMPNASVPELRSRTETKSVLRSGEDVQRNSPTLGVIAKLASGTRKASAWRSGVKKFEPRANGWVGKSANASAPLSTSSGRA